MNNRIRKIVENIKNSYNGSIIFDEPMKLHTTMKVGGNAGVFTEPKDVSSLLLLIYECKKNDVRFFVIGGGSNIIANDCGFNGVIISMNSFDSIKNENSLIVCGAGVKTNDMVNFYTENGISGMECFAGLPGTCGGACYMNARCYSYDISSKIEYVEYLDIEKINENSLKFIERHIKIYHNMEDDWSYKHSPFMTGKRIVLKVAFKSGQSEPENRERIKSDCERFIRDRESKGHFKAPSSGSIFKNSRDFGKPSGMLIEEAGLKGIKIGGAQIAPWHGNIIINTGNATCSDIKDLVHTVQEKVCKQTGYLLECEVIFL